MKPWQSKGARTRSTEDLEDTSGPAPGRRRASRRRPFLVDEHVRGIALLLAQSEPFWRATGKRRPVVAQFAVPGDPRSSWFVEVDAAGARAQVGMHRSPSVTWESDLEAMQAAFAGTVFPQRIRVRGDFEEMRALFAAIAQTRLPGDGAAAAGA